MRLIREVLPPRACRSPSDGRGTIFCVMVVLYILADALVRSL